MFFCLDHNMGFDVCQLEINDKHKIINERRASQLRTIRRLSAWSNPGGEIYAVM